MKRKPKLLDLFCGAGGAGKGYHDAGFSVVGVDIEPQPNFPFEFIQSDALALDPSFLRGFDVVHASPPCQAYSVLAKRTGCGHRWPKLVAQVREQLAQCGKLTVIENVPGSPLIDPIVLCGTMFPELRVVRHRLFEVNFPVAVPPHRKHPLVHTLDKRKPHYGKTDDMVAYVSITGGGNCSIRAARDAMKIDWMTKNEMNQSIPPAYARHIGKAALRHLRRKQWQKA